MTVIGLTGPSGSGKGEVAKILSEYGAVHIDADAVYHNLLLPPSECLDELVEEFGANILNAGGLLDRRIVSEMVFADPDKLDRLNKITHKYVCSRIRQIIRYHESNACIACVIDAPLLYEAGLDLDCDFVICIIADKDIRARRIALRDSITVERAYTRINAQKPDDFYSQRSKYIISNDSDRHALDLAVADILRQENIGGIL